MEWNDARIASCKRKSEGCSLGAWLAQRREASEYKVDQISLNDLRRWEFKQSDHRLYLGHDTGRFFTIEGRRIRTNFGSMDQWDQVVIRQPERGLLGILSRIRNGVLELLIQAKMEPGCINGIQASPTIQATKSNYTQVHEGSIPAYYSSFANFDGADTWVTWSPQVEQTTRFLRKKNVNAFLTTSKDSDVPISEDFRWCTLRDLKDLYLQDNGVNMNTRSVLACLPPLVPASGFVDAELLSEEGAVSILVSRLYASLEFNEVTNNRRSSGVMMWLNRMREIFEMESTSISLDDLRGWRVDEKVIESDYFSVVGVRVRANREVAEWDQPLIAQPENGLSVFVGKTIDGVPSLLFQAKCDVGGEPPVYLAPTVSCSVPSIRRGTPLAPPFLDDIMGRSPEEFAFNATLSEEGGRFQECENDYKILWDESFLEKPIPENYRWIAYETVFELVRHGYLNIEARSLFGFLV